MGYRPRPVLSAVPDADPDRALPPGQRAVPLRRFGLRQFAGWRPPEPLPTVLAVRGAVELPAQLDLADLAAVLPRRQQRSDLHCVATWSTPDLLWSGFPFEAFHHLLIERVRPDPDARWVDCLGLDGYRCCLALDDLLEHQVLLADRLGGAPLTAAHGVPLRLVAPAQYGYKSVKHLAVLEFRHDYRAGSAGWLEHPRARVDREERGTSLPVWAYRPLGRLLLPALWRAYRRAETRR